MQKVSIKGDIVNNDTADFYDFWGITNYSSPKNIEKALQNANHQPINVEIASNGGDVFAGSEIYSMLKGYDGEVTIDIVGLAASAASVIAMAGDKVRIAPTAQIMIHQAWTDAQGNADDLNHQANVLGAVDKSIANAYVSKTGIDEDTLLNMMANETWLTAKEAVDKGFADEVMFQDDNKSQPVFNAVGSSVVTKATLNKFRNMMIKMQADKERSENSKNESKSAILLHEKLQILRGEDNGNQ